jgi:DNA-directed RNA polymerase II subunit RPB2
MIGCADDPDELVQKFRLYRRWRDLPIDASICYKREMGEIYIQVDKGDCYRPLVRVDRINLFHSTYRRFSEYPHLLWEVMLTEGVIEYISKEEESSLYIAVDYEVLFRNPERNYTHVDLMPAEMFGVAASVIPFSNRNQAPRNIYQASMGKQSISTRAIDFAEKADSKVHILNNAQKPLVTTTAAKTMELEKDPAGQMAVVAICCYTGFNQEDSLILNKDSLDRGLFSSSYHRIVRASETTRGGETVQIQSLPAGVIGKKRANRDKIDENGIIRVGSRVQKGDVIVSKTNAYKRTKQGVDGKMIQEMVKQDRSHVSTSEEECVVGTVMTQPSVSGGVNILVGLDSHRKPEIGDKFSSRHGQKGICGMILPQVDMPYTQDGIVPDIIMNPHALPSRMTIGQLFESVMGKVCCVQGRIGNGTPFRNISINDIEQECRKAKITNLGKEVMYSGMTGEKMKNPVFITPVYYQRLKHMVRDKFHARSTGAVQFLTRQPEEGRSKKGGFRMGEMERDALISHGVSEFLLDRLLRQSDLYVTTMCTVCKRLAEPATKGNRFRKERVKTVQRTTFCRTCQSSKNIVRVEMPYAAKLLMQELQACGIDMKMKWE